MRSILGILAAGSICWALLVACDDDADPGGPNGPRDPVITNVSPSEAVAGQTVTITGSNFGFDASLVAVTFDAIIGPIVSVSSNTIVAVVPSSLPPGATTLRVSVSGASTTASATITIVEPPRPVISGFDPDTAVAGDTLTILGQDFGESVGETSVTIGGAPAQILSVTNAATVVAIPGTLSGTVAVVVTVLGQASAPRTLTVVARGPSSAGAVFGRVTSVATGQAIGGAEVTTRPATASVLTDAEGNYRIEDVGPGTFSVTAVKEGFDSATVQVTVAAGESTMADLALRPLGQSTIFGRVTNASTEAGIGGAQVTLSVIADTIPVIGDTIPIASDLTDGLGNYRIENVSPGTYVLTARANGFASLSVEVTAVAGQLVFVNFPLTPATAAVTVREAVLAMWSGPRADRSPTRPWRADRQARGVGSARRRKRPGSQKQGGPAGGTPCRASGRVVELIGLEPTTS
ncbi:MAG: carboxypeptidase regulatory-like domain-containing protein [Gemmatimonadota bacterium]